MLMLMVLRVTVCLLYDWICYCAHKPNKKKTQTTNANKNNRSDLLSSPTKTLPSSSRPILLRILALQQHARSQQDKAILFAGRPVLFGFSRCVCVCVCVIHWLPPLAAFSHSIPFFLSNLVFPRSLCPFVSPTPFFLGNHHLKNICLQ